MNRSKPAIVWRGKAATDARGVLAFTKYGDWRTGRNWVTWDYRARTGKYYSGVAKDLGHVRHEVMQLADELPEQEVRV